MRVDDYRSKWLEIRTPRPPCLETCQSPSLETCTSRSTKFRDSQSTQELWTRLILLFGNACDTLVAPREGEGGRKSERKTETESESNREIESMGVFLCVCVSVCVCVYLTLNPSFAFIISCDFLLCPRTRVFAVAQWAIRQKRLLQRITLEAMPFSTRSCHLRRPQIQFQ